MSDATRVPRIGVGVIIQRNGRVLLGQRLGSHGAGRWALPGGHLEFGESIEGCAAREALEETGLVIADLHFGPYVNTVFERDDHHYVTLFVIAQHADGEPQNREPDKCAGWDWFDWSSLPEPLFAPLQALVQTGFAPNA